MTIGFKAEGETILLIGATTGWLGASAYLATICGREEGAPPPVDLAAEKRNGDFVRGLIEAGRVTAVHDCSDGGLAVALAEMAMAGGVGCTVSAGEPGLPAHAFLFGEDQARYVLTTRPGEADAITAEAAAAGVPAMILGVTSGAALTLPGSIQIAIHDLRTAHESWMPAYMG
jgi:phosphoribosylformylglycinamidine synthase